MSRRCPISGNGVMSGNNVSHANNKTRRRFLPNIQPVTLISEALGVVKMRMAVHSLRTIEHNKGLDQYLLKTSNLKLTAEGRKLKKRILTSRKYLAA